jgi:hypothetical protein
MILTNSYATVNVSCWCMKQIVLIILTVFTASHVFAQQSDFIVLKKKNNRTLRTYYPGAFISAETYTGFPINGYIVAIRNDSIIWRQEELRLMQSKEGMGTEIDTFVYTIGIPYTNISQFNYGRNYSWGGKKGFVQVYVPKIMILGGVGFIVLELVNTAYRHEKLNDSKKLTSLAIAAGVALTGWLIEQSKERNKKVGKKYKVVYVKAKQNPT